MAEFEPAFARLMKDEGVVLTNDPTDRGGQTFAGISRKFHPNWSGWKDIDHGGIPPMNLVREFYRENFWNPIRAEEITSQRIAEVLFSQFANMGANGINIMQTSLGLIADGKVGAKTLGALNDLDEEIVLMRYALANVARYHAIGMKDKTQRKYWPGWFRRALEVCK